MRFARSHRERLWKWRTRARFPRNRYRLSDSVRQSACEREPNGQPDRHTHGQRGADGVSLLN